MFTCFLFYFIILFAFEAQGGFNLSLVLFHHAWLLTQPLKKSPWLLSLMNPCELCFVHFCGKGWPLTLAGICPARGALCGRNTRTPGEASASSGRPPGG